MFNQLNENPRVEISCIDRNFNTLRITRKAVFVTSEETQAKALEIMPDLGKMYSVRDNKFEIFSIYEAIANCYSISGKI